jgi:hypothetical protein
MLRVQRATLSKRFLYPLEEGEIERGEREKRKMEIYVYLKKE